MEILPATESRASVEWSLICLNYVYLILEPMIVFRISIFKKSA